ncbi:MAG: hypothetical protein COU08_01380 [Candidatus Harrisonbacteria bacterium CG10_big_fil_rev_8_21_14_0_10_42_17]|uniref:Phenylacetate--CoA ligase n=1 Tax=Candidatus Harrisonbacteria bacterium CG10_big_fil_rev_8_21_14_0_10_42_17 TaxID=1974584 RepID=A0A2M6WIN6_9BACT|nr:MAG: hypothetical protein COU08_01380 [Candidatus Harrisonbacteria bacterium CG10_big_fil_rev_8_21_14_0_10_42_17]
MSEFHRRNVTLGSRRILDFFRDKNERYWTLEGQKRALRLFHLAAKRVPAYKDFLKKNSISPAKIRTYKDFQLVPPTSKKTYLRNYPLEKLCWDGTLKKPLVFTSTSGSTGEPFYFPRGEKLDWEYSILAEMFLRNSSYGFTHEPVLVIVGLGMGAWIGGLITYKAFEIAGLRGNAISIITPGSNKEEIFHALRKLAPRYKQVILVGYPPFIKDVIDEALELDIKLRNLNLRLLFAAEAFNEKFRDYISHNVGIKHPILDTLNVYGTADIGAMAWETPTSILIRRLALRTRRVFKELFGFTNKIPTLAQYNPLFIHFESLQGEIVLSGSNEIPLVRYLIGDSGGVLSYDFISKTLSGHEISLEKASRKENIPYLSQMPFVYVCERSDFSTKLYGAIIYPEHIREVFYQKSFTSYFTGKFTLITKHDRSHNEFLEINIELKPKVRQNKKIQIALLHSITQSLLKQNAEYHYLAGFFGKRIEPRLVFWRYEHPTYFKRTIKQRWVKIETASPK